tara:strand:- start:355 stop:2106 length:1752 start_codon:yes stop_codon:yes gene_type:complete
MNKLSDKSVENNELDLRILFNFLLRNKFVISTFAGIFFVLFCLISLSLKRVWSGQFQIVLSDSETSNLQGTDLFSTFSSFLSLPSNLAENSLDTEIGILKSPSVLLPLYEFYNNEVKKNKIQVKDLSFNNWKDKKLKIELTKKTSILNITYLDTETDLIIPVLKKMSKIYQDYSGKNKRRDIMSSKNYLIDQIKVYRDKSNESIRKAQSYALDKDLTAIDASFPSKNSYLSSITKLSQFQNKRSIIPNNNNEGDPFGGIINVEVSRLNAVNQIKNIDIKIKKIQELGDNSSELQYISFIAPNLMQNNLIDKQLLNIDKLLVEMQNKYTDKYQGIERLKSKRKALINFLKERTINLLKAERLDAQTRLEAATRPKGVLLNYKQLIREANRDEATLSQLEDELRNIKLREAQTNNPWELITEPTFNDIPVGPQRKIIGLFGLFTGIIIGSLKAYWDERKSDLILDYLTLEYLINAKILEKVEFSSENNKIIKSELFINQVIQTYGEDNIKFLISESTDKNKLDEYSKNTKITKDRLFDKKNMFAIDKNTKIVFIASIGSVTFKEVKEIVNKFDSLDKKFFGIIVL